MSLFLILVQIQDVTIPVRSTSRLVASRSVKEASFILGLNFGISYLKMLHLVSLCRLSRLLSGLSSWTSCRLYYLVCPFILVSWVSFNFCFVALFVCFGLPFNLALLHYWVLPGFGRMLWIMCSPSQLQTSCSIYKTLTCHTNERRWMTLQLFCLHQLKSIILDTKRLSNTLINRTKQQTVIEIHSIYVEALWSTL